eukprot:5151311-Pyramimonas_sp.AAC.1
MGRPKYPLGRHNQHGRGRPGPSRSWTLLAAPSKARFGSLPGIQSVPRAARFAGLQAVSASRAASRIVSDHL